MNSHMPAILVVMVLLVGCRDAQPRHGPEAAMTSEALPARAPVTPSVGQGGGETPEGLSGDVATPAITVVTSALESADPEPGGDSRDTGAADQSFAVSASYAATEDEVLAAVQAYFPASEWGRAMSVAECETGGTFNPGLIGAHGEQGVYQVLAVYHGSVPSDITGQVAQAAGIVAREGWQPWSCR